MAPPREWIANKITRGAIKDITARVMLDRVLRLLTILSVRHRGAIRWMGGRGFRNKIQSGKVARERLEAV
jgi:hypothetical protein